MSIRPHLLVAITAHGHGHMAQTAPVVNRLRTLRPDLRLTLASALPAATLASHFHTDWEYLPCAWDLGMQMGSALDVDVAASAAAIRSTR